MSQTTSQELAKSFEPADIEARWYPIWENRGYFKAGSDPAKPGFAIQLPPPNITGILHMGHAFNQTVMDSLTRFSMAQREIGLASGEPPVTRGYPPSVYSEMPKLLERAGRAAVGSITGLYTVLVDGDDFNEPITDTARSILDGHIMLDRKLGHKNHYPAIDILQSISRCMSQIATREHKQAANKLKNVLATYNEAEDLINIGAYKKGSNPNIEYAISRIDAVNGFLCQGTDEKFTFEETVQMLEELFADQG